MESIRNPLPKPPKYIDVDYMTLPDIDSNPLFYDEDAQEILKKADPATFVSNNDGYFAWDARFIFWGGYLLPKADLQSWRIVNTEMDLSRDDKHFYILNKLVTEEEWNQKLLG